MAHPSVLLVTPYPARDMEALERRFAVHRLWEAPDRDAYLAEHAPHLRAIATNGERGASAELIASLPALEIIACYGVGVDAIDFPAARARGIAVTNTPGVLTDDVADLALALMLATARQMPQAERHIRDGRWPSGPYPLAARMSGKRLGIVGLGRIGQAIARRAEAFGMEVAYYSRAAKPDFAHRHYATIPELASGSDFLVAALAGGPDTLGLIGADAFAALGPEGVFVNVARGSVVDEAALLDALEQGRIRGAGIDVMLNEPDIDPRFLKLDNVVLQPHQGSATTETRAAMGDLVVANLAAHFEGNPLLTPVP